MTITNSAYEHKLKGCVRITKIAAMYFRNCSRPIWQKKCLLVL